MGLHVGVSAFEDRRFEPIWEEELPFLSCSVSLLFRFEVASDWLVRINVLCDSVMVDEQDWEPGVHGLVIRLYDGASRSNSTATFLPHVPIENCWSREETVRKLIRKSGDSVPYTDPQSIVPAGYHAAITDALLSKIEITRYRTTLASLTYEEYMKLKNGFSNGH